MSFVGRRQRWKMFDLSSEEWSGFIFSRSFQFLLQDLSFEALR